MATFYRMKKAIYNEVEEWLNEYGLVLTNLDKLRETYNDLRLRIALKYGISEKTIKGYLQLRGLEYEDGILRKITPVFRGKDDAQTR